MAFFLLHLKKQPFSETQKDTLEGIVAAGVADNALRAAVAKQGLDADALLGPKSKKAVAAATTPGEKKGREKKEKKERAPRDVSHYQVFTSLAMERIKADPNNPAFKVSGAEPSVLPSQQSAAWQGPPCMLC